MMIQDIILTEYIFMLQVQKIRIIWQELLLTVTDYLPQVLKSHHLKEVFHLFFLKKQFFNFQDYYLISREILQLELAKTKWIHGIQIG